jgi:hypothetical protein
MLNLIVGRFHACTPDAEIRAAIRKRIPATWPKPDRDRIVAEAVRIHRRNRRLYLDVMGGRIG